MGNFISQVYKKFECFNIYYKNNNNVELTEFLINKDELVLEEKILLKNSEKTVFFFI